VVYDERRIWVKIDYDQAPAGMQVDGSLKILWSTSLRDEWEDWDQLSVLERQSYREGITKAGGDNVFRVEFTICNPERKDIHGFVESNGYLSIEAENFSRASGSDAHWQIIEGLGRSGHSITVLPTNATPITDPETILNHSPCVEYDLYLFRTGPLKLTLNCSPSYPINGDFGQRVAVSLDDQTCQIIEYEKGNRDVMSNLMTLHGDLQVDRPGQHVLKIRMVDPGIVIDKIILDTGGLKESYLGPPESGWNEGINE